MMKRTDSQRDWLPAALLIFAVVLAGLPLILTVTYASEYDFFYVPLASWFVLLVIGLMLMVIGYFWRRSRVVHHQLHQTRAELAELNKPVLDDDLPVVTGHKQLDRPEFLTIVQMLFRRPASVKVIDVKPLPGGYGGSVTLLVRLQSEAGAPRLPRPFVVKVGDSREMAGEYDKLVSYVRPYLAHGAALYRRAGWGDRLGIAYEFVGLNPDAEVTNFHQIYAHYTTAEAIELVKEIFAQLDRAWYQAGQVETLNLYREYDLLSAKHELIIEHVGDLLAEDDPYRMNLAAKPERFRSDVRPAFCATEESLWYDPVMFLKEWPKRELSVAAHRSIVHGDLNARNILVEVDPSGRKQVWFIDFSHTGNGLSQERVAEALQAGRAIDPARGHTLRDFCRLEADIKFVLTRLYDDDDLRRAMAFEAALAAGGLNLDERPASSLADDILGDERFQKAWQVIGEIRRRAKVYLAHADDRRPYWISLLHATLPIVYYRPEQFENERQQKRYAFMSAGMLCSQL